MHTKLYAGNGKVLDKIFKSYMNMTSALPKLLKIPEFAAIAQLFTSTPEQFLDVSLLKLTGSIKLEQE